MFNILVVATSASEKRLIVTILSRQGYGVVERESCEEIRLPGQASGRLDLVIYAGPEGQQPTCDCPMVRILDGPDPTASGAAVYRPIRQEALLEAIYGVLAQVQQGPGT